jgi:glucose-6-phosphate 1-dehydrogenase
MTTLRNHHVDPHLFVVLGATSDLMRRKLLPAIYRLRAAGEVPHFTLSVAL